MPAPAAATRMVGSLNFSPNLFLLFRAVVGSIGRRVLVVKSSRSLCTFRRLFLTPGDTLPASPLLGSKTTPVTSVSYTHLTLPTILLV